MKKNFLYSLIISVVLVSVIAFSIVTSADECQAHNDATANGVCDNCGVPIDGISALAGHSMNLSENINFMFWFDFEYNVSPNSYIEFEVGGRTERVLVSSADDASGYKVFTVELAVKELADEISATYVFENGTKGTTYKFTAKEYCEKILADTNSENYKIYSDLIISLMNYAGYAQEYFNYNTDNLANEGLFSGVNPVLGAEVKEADLSATGELPEGIMHRGATLVLESKIAIRHYFVTENDISQYTFKCGGKTLTPVADETPGAYYVEIADVSPRSLDRMYTITVNETYSANYSVMTYAYRQSSNTAKPKLANLSKAIFLYSEAAEAIPSVLYYTIEGSTATYREDIEDDGVDLPVAPAKDGYEFDGWYTSASLDSKLNEMPDEDFDGIVTAYGRYRYILHSESNKIWTPKIGSDNFSGTKYVRGDYFKLPDKAITYHFSISRPTDEQGNPTTLSMSIRLRNNKQDIVTIAEISAAGVVTLKGKDTITLGTLGSDPTDLYIVVDFKNQKLYAKSFEGEYVTTTFSLSSNAEYTNASDWYDDLKKTEDSSVRFRAFQIRANSGIDGKNSVTFNSIKVLDGKDTWLDAAIDEQLQNYYQGIKDAVGNFNNSDFGPSITLDMVAVAAEKGSTFATPSVSPEIGEHPRVMVTEDMLPAIKIAMANPDNSAAVTAFWKLANTENNGILPPATLQGRGEHNFSYPVLDSIQAKAFAYLITGEEHYAYEAILAMKNYLLTLDIKYMNSDQTREFGYTMHIAACVYDWCYDKLTDDDKFQITAGVEHKLCTGTTENTTLSTYGGAKMEMGFPPTGQGAVTGHGSERQLMRDYLSFAIAIYDEVPSWWNYIGGRFYAQYIPVRNEYYKSGMYPQGTTVYVSGRFMSDLYSAVLIKAITGESPYSADMKNVIHSMVSHETADGYIFSTGDGTINTTPNEIPKGYGYDAILSAYVNNDNIALSIAKELGYGFSKFDGGSESVTPTLALICLQGDLDPVASYRDELSMIRYNGGFLGQMITRNTWESDAVATFMKISERNTGNHDHQAAGTFQIYYKGMLTGDTGTYKGYGTTQHNYFHKATISHNGLLIFNPDLHDDELTYDDNQKVKNADRYYYTGGQRRFGETSTLSGWMSDDYKTGTVTGYSYAYDENGAPVYSYLAGDITPAYDAVTVDYVGRTMLTAYTGNADIPMVFFVFDRIDADSADFKKTFLLQIPGADEPAVDSSAKTVTVVNGDGKLVLKNILGGDSITKRGGEGQNYLVNDAQLAEETCPKTWGRVEISPNTGNKSDILLNVIYVTDSSGNASLSPSEIAISSQYGSYKGAVAGNIAAVFNADTAKSAESLSFETTGSGDITYYIGGLQAGVWNVTAGGESFTATATEDGGIITFTAPAGAVTVSPSEAVIPENAVRINYKTNNGILGDGVKGYYIKGEVTQLTDNVTREGYKFAGWYRDEALTVPISEISATEDAVLTVFAKWEISFANESYTETTLNTTNGTTVNGVRYSGASSGATSTIVTDNSGGSLKWTTANAGPSIFVTKSTCGKSIAEMNSNIIVYHFEFAVGIDTSTMNLGIRVRDEASPNKNQLTLGSISGGAVMASNKTTLVTLTEAMQSVTYVVDFNVGKIYCYNSSGTLVTTTTFSAPAGYETTAAWKEGFTSEVLSLRANNGGEINIGLIEIYETSVNPFA